MEISLWDKLSDEARAEVDELINSGRTIQAIASMREHTGPPVPELRECVDLLADRQAVLFGPV
ncbi:hypothetical protein [Streptomyces hesseae]|uniref:Uncharacterized protein n=1 Tax=Streptomyces hesseae TaxID=3075519 RepID=A0ABU2T0N1_9ACTN|nr:hypothetical protein [Streptomyces sp. DSM 40473]MDT0453750.1 hypothetical protein [Streptomyces sp. DSM 40473]